MLLYESGKVTQGPQYPHTMNTLIHERNLVIHKSDRLAMIFRASLHLSDDAFTGITGAYHEHLFSLSIDHLFTEDPRR
jgi:hypothetical protein